MKAERIGKILSVPVGNGRKQQVGGSRGEKISPEDKEGTDRRPK